MSARKSNTKNGPKIPRPLSDEIVCRAIDQLKTESLSAWNRIPKDKLEELCKKHKIDSFEDYIEQLEQAVNDKKYLLGTADSYRYKICQLSYNLHHNGVTLFVKYKPRKLADVSSYDLGIVDPSLPPSTDSKLPPPPPPHTTSSDSRTVMPKLDNDSSSSSSSSSGPVAMSIGEDQVRSNTSYFPIVDRLNREASKPPSTKIKNSYEINNEIKLQNAKHHLLFGPDE